MNISTKKDKKKGSFEYVYDDGEHKIHGVYNPKGEAKLTGYADEIEPDDEENEFFMMDDDGEAL